MCKSSRKCLSDVRGTRQFSHSQIMSKDRNINASPSTPPQIFHLRQGLHTSNYKWWSNVPWRCVVLSRDLKVKKLPPQWDGFTSLLPLSRVSYKHLNPHWLIFLLHINISLFNFSNKASNFEDNLVSSFKYQSHDFQACWAAQLKSATPASVQTPYGQILWNDLQDAKKPK